MVLMEAEKWCGALQPGTLLQIVVMMVHDECYTLAPLHVAGTKTWCQVRFN